MYGVCNAAGEFFTLGGVKMATFMPGGISIYTVRYTTLDQAERVVAALQRDGFYAGVHVVDIPALTEDEQRELAAAFAEATRPRRRSRRSHSASVRN